MDLPNPTTSSPRQPPVHLERAVRQREVVPPEALAGCHAVVVGVGAIGRQVALQLAAIGIPLLILYDHDRVEEVNLAPQGYRPDQLTFAKVDATASDCQRTNPQVHVIPKAEPFRRSTARQISIAHSALVVFACVDSITTRGLVWESVRSQAALYIDAA